MPHGLEVILDTVPLLAPRISAFAAIVASLLPILWNEGTGSEVMQRIAVPMIGGMVSSTVLTLVVIPAIYFVVKGFALRREPAKQPVSLGTTS